MAIKYTYGEFENKAREAGMLDQFSEADMKLARENPNAGMGILSAKIGYSNAGTDEERNYFHNEGQRIRRESSRERFVVCAVRTKNHLDAVRGRTIFGDEPTVRDRTRA